MTFVEAIKAVYEGKKQFSYNERVTSFQIKKGLENNLTNKKVTIMKKFLILMICLLSLTFMTSCKEHFSDGERVGTVVKFSKAGVIWDSWDGDLNLTATGMNTSGEPFAFSFDNDRSDQDSLINLLIDAQRYGWKVKIIYHQVWGLKNFCMNRGESDYFVDGVEVLDKNFAKPLGGISSQSGPTTKGRVVDTVWVVIDKSQLKSSNK